MDMALVDLHFWEVFFRWAAGIGGLVALLATLAHYQVKTVIDRQERRANEAHVNHLNYRIDHLTSATHELGTRLAPFEKVARWKYPKPGTGTSLTKLQSELEKAKAHAIEMAEKTGPRSLPGPLVSHLISTLSKFPGQKVQMMSPEGNEEALQFAKQFETVFRDAGWHVEEGQQQVFTAPVIGIVVMVGKNPAPEPAAKLALMLKNGGFGVGGQLNYSLSERIRVIVGAHPLAR